RCDLLRPDWKRAEGDRGRRHRLHGEAVQPVRSTADDAPAGSRGVKRPTHEVTRMRWTGQLLIVLALSVVGCARGDWTTETLTLVDVTGTWEGVFRTAGLERTTQWALRQKGGKVRGEVLGLNGAPVGSIEGLVNGEVFSWRAAGAVLSTQLGNAP